MTKDSLRIFKEISGVDGAFLLNRGGQLVLLDAPSFLPPDTFNQMGNRVNSLLAASDEALPGEGEIFLKGTLQSFYFRRCGEHSLGVLCREGVPVSQLRMVSNIFARQLPAALSALAAAPAAAQPVAQRPAPAKNSPPPRPTTTRRGIWG